MCGICGILYEDSTMPVDRARLIDMRDRMKHRGPDGAGLLVEPGIGLGHRRLSIVDVAGGHQPLSNEDGSLWIVFNGEIYNHESLRAHLIGKGHTFRTRSDTEAIVHLYEEYGPDCLERLNGMFAFAIWDKRSRRLFLARDRMGVKPLYYWQGRGAFAFASEIKSLLAWDFVRASLGKESIPEYLVFRHLSGEGTLFENVRSLEPGHHMTLSASGMLVRRYWHLPFDPGAGRTSLRDRVEELDHLLRDSVKLRLMSEVPLGTYCSGGVDSSLVTAYTSRLTTTPLNTFSVGFEDPDFDESEQARLAARVCGTTHHPLTVTEQMFADALPQAVWFHDQPLNHPNSVPILLLSRMAKKSVTVMLSGEGSDELFGGYPRYRVLAARRMLGGIPARLASPAKWLASKLRTRRLDKLVGALGRPLEEMLVANPAFVDEQLARKACVLEREWAWPSRHARLEEARKSGPDPFAWLFYLDLTQYLVSLLERQDKMSMAAGIESRVPFLDYRVVQLALRTGDEHKVSLSATKVVVKKLAERYLPRSIIYQRKSGFGVPLAQWFRNRKGLGRYLDYLASSAFRRRGIWNVSAVDRCVDEHMAARKDHSELLWVLLNLELWSATYLDRDGTGVLS